MDTGTREMDRHVKVPAELACQPQSLSPRTHEVEGQNQFPRCPPNSTQTQWHEISKINITVLRTKQSKNRYLPHHCIVKFMSGHLGPKINFRARGTNVFIVFNNNRRFYSFSKSQHLCPYWIHLTSRTVAFREAETLGVGPAVCGLAVSPGCSPCSDKLENHWLRRA